MHYCIYAYIHIYANLFLTAVALLLLPFWPKLAGKEHKNKTHLTCMCVSACVCVYVRTRFPIPLLHPPPSLMIQHCKCNSIAVIIIVLFLFFPSILEQSKIKIGCLPNAAGREGRGAGDWGHMASHSNRATSCSCSHNQPTMQYSILIRQQEPSKYGDICSQWERVINSIFKRTSEF